MADAPKSRSGSKAPASTTASSAAPDTTPPAGSVNSHELTAARRDAGTLAWLARQQRTLREPRLGLDWELNKVRRDVASTRRRVGQLLGPWEQLVPDEIKGRSRVDGLRGDTLMITVDAPSTRFQLDRLIRSGLSRSMDRATKGKVRRIRVRIGPLDDRR
ncbi:MAG: DciA family protein [Phycisphaerales bacterium]